MAVATLICVLMNRAIAIPAMSTSSTTKLLSGICPNISSCISRLALQVAVEKRARGMCTTFSLACKIKEVEGSLAFPTYITGHVHSHSVVIVYAPVIGAFGQQKQHDPPPPIAQSNVRTMM